MLPQPPLLPCRGMACLPRESFSRLMLYTIGLIGDGKYVSDFLWGLITSSLSHWSLISGIYVSGRSVSQWHWSQCPLEITVEQQIDVKTLEINELMQDFSSLPSLTVHILISWAFDSAEIERIDWRPHRMRESCTVSLRYSTQMLSLYHPLPMTVSPSVGIQTSGISPRTQT